MRKMSDRELLEFIAAQVGKLTNNITDFKNETAQNFKEVNLKLDSLEKRVIVMENDHGSKLNALLDGYKQLAEGLEDINKDITTLSTRQDNQELQIKVLKGTSK